MIRRTRESDPLDWAKGRLVAMRSDGARRSFNPEATMLFRSDQERKLAAATLHELYMEVQARKYQLDLTEPTESENL